MNKPCRVCGKPQRDAICPACKAGAERARPSRQARGYNAEYERNRAAMIDRAWSTDQACVICGRRFASRGEITAEHLTPLRRGGTSATVNLGPAHGACNSGWRRNRK